MVIVVIVVDEGREYLVGVVWFVVLRQRHWCFSMTMVFSLTDRRQTWKQARGRAFPKTNHTTLTIYEVHTFWGIPLRSPYGRPFVCSFSLAWPRFSIARSSVGPKGSFYLENNIISEMSPAFSLLRSRFLGRSDVAGWYFFSSGRPQFHSRWPEHSSPSGGSCDGILVLPICRALKIPSHGVRAYGSTSQRAANRLKDL